jgi:hypothetical protein
MNEFEARDENVRLQRRHKEAISILEKLIARTVKDEGIVVHDLLKIMELLDPKKKETIEMAIKLLSL